ncbi:EAL and HDOD domain-containing protein [Pseudoalteromonas maricaloris]|uniref:HDOD domain-containing protein n=1 Tax=Pseudoalteromonas maricaloris TaxID=184924 RepID=A0A8I2H3I6_9GAMM|nr:MULTISPECIES: HDOD domain-containing protein [Pseudoalteromonas]KID38118.1 diguanylate phosphodiesterase [Pseudoalteromonas flavipulchra NCIMB 2033 = ATCC BAA-314]MBD0782708.1 HDOD domain-containing protein [Pseudoalteromonas flavipulchra]MBE0372290.1 putative signal transduction protein [Pseudoalteromonas flavipulchra NCIMB 2033 = ATCC BAA-314]NLR20564.1 HDOD domain-containing protein [Pseudoalteromonas maricaloris]WOX29949.1 HDOD domain-containing protein [Pseudoalteromonas maricaloris]
MYFYAARQPIFDVQRELIGYELLFRDGLNNVFPEIDGDEATSRLVEGSQFTFGLDDLTNQRPAYINFTLETLAKGYVQMLAPEQVVVEILETVQPGKRLLACVKELKEQGYTLALDDYHHQNVWRHFFPYIDQIKVDLLATNLEQIHTIKTAIQDFPNIDLVAEKVETYEQFELAKSLGFKYFQGFFFAKPEMVKTKALAPSELAMAELLYETSSVEPDLARITQVFERDVNLSYKLLRYANSAVFKRRAEISTIKQALVVLGSEELKRLISLLFASQLNTEKPKELLSLSLLRAHFMEAIATKANKVSDTGSTFLVGMMSLMDAILDDDMASLLTKLPLSQEIKSTLLKKPSAFGIYLDLAESMEKGDWESVETISKSLGVTSQNIAELYQKSQVWSDTQIKAIE